MKKFIILALTAVSLGLMGAGSAEARHHKWYYGHHHYHHGYYDNRGHHYGRGHDRGHHYGECWHWGINCNR